MAKLMWSHGKDRSTLPLPYCTVTIKRGCASIDTGIPGYRYNIELDRIDSPERMVHWLHHLSSKTWFTPKMVGDLIQTVGKHYEWDFHSWR
jgi:hypothetical protein